MQTSPITSFQPVIGEVTADVAVVGGGIAGLCTAWELAKAGRSVVVVEAGRIASATTGYTTAKVTSLHTAIYAKLAQHLGSDTARLYAISQQSAIARLASVVADLHIDCDLESRDAYTYTTSPDGVADLYAEAQAATDAGLAAGFVTGTGLPFPVTGAVRLADQAQFHPRKFLLALAADLIRLGGRVYEQSRVVGLAEGSSPRLTTESGAGVTAGHVVVTTGFPIFDRQNCSPAWSRAGNWS